MRLPMQTTQGCVGAAYHLTSKTCSLKSSMDACDPVDKSIVTVYPNMDCDGGDMDTIQPLDLTSCITECGENANCTGVQYNWGQECILKSKCTLKFVQTCKLYVSFLARTRNLGKWHRFSVTTLLMILLF